MIPFRPRQRTMKTSYEGRLFKKILKNHKKRQLKRQLNIEAIQSAIFRTPNNKIVINSNKNSKLKRRGSKDDIHSELTQFLESEELKTPQKKSTFNFSYSKCEQCDGRASRSSKDGKTCQK